jgi:SAM-dependent methyltransferase
MNLVEFQFFSEKEKSLPDASSLPTPYLLKCLLIKLLRKIRRNQKTRLVWTVSAISDANDHTATVRNYLEQKTIRQILNEMTQGRRLGRACEVGCGYGRVIMVLKEFADYVKGFERESHFVEIARSLQPEIEFQCINSLIEIEEKESYDLVMTCTVLQHLSDNEAQQVCSIMKRLAPKGHILLIEKTDPFNITDNIEDGTKFISRARSIDTYSEYMLPYSLVMIREMVAEPTYSNPKPGKCMLFASPHL